MNDLTGQRFSRLTVKSYAGYIRSGKVLKHLWKCVCDCGKEKTTREESLKTNGCKSCGCLRNEKLKKSMPKITKRWNELSIEERTVNFFIDKTKRGAWRRFYEFSLTHSEVKSLIFLPCFYCGKEVSGTFRTNDQTMLYHNGIDRVNNSFGYIRGNCVTSCKNCNFKKAAVDINIMIKALQFLGYKITKEEII